MGRSTPLGLHIEEMSNAHRFQIGLERGTLTSSGLRLNRVPNNKNIIKLILSFKWSFHFPFQRVAVLYDDKSLHCVFNKVCTSAFITPSR